MKINDLLKQQQDYFCAGNTRSYETRICALKKLQTAIRQEETQIADALFADLRKSAQEAYMCEIGLTLSELSYQIKHLHTFMQEKRVRTPLTQFPSKSFISPEPYGSVLIMAPWNYPFLLSIGPLIGSIASGNCTVIKPSCYASHTSHAVHRLLSTVFPPEHVAVIEGGRSENKALLAEKFDYIFFTGSIAVGKEVMSAAAQTLTPVTLELGGKSPVIIDRTADLCLAARRIAFGKILNAGQTCVAPDYVLIDKQVKDKFLTEYRSALTSFFPDGKMQNMPVIINEKHFQRLCSLLSASAQHIVIGGASDPQKRFIEPTVLDHVTDDAPIMQEEIFGPILPVLSVSDLNSAINFVRNRPWPLALYLFTKSRAAERQVLDCLSFGGGCINDTVLHLATPHLPFGGIGDSGMGQYHGKSSFDTFSHYRGIVKKAARFDISARYHPYSAKKSQILHRFMK